MSALQTCSAALWVPDLAQCRYEPVGAVCGVLRAAEVGRKDVPGGTPTVAAVPCCLRHREELREALGNGSQFPVTWVRLRDLPDFMESVMEAFGAPRSGLRLV